MMEEKLVIRQFEKDDQDQVVELFWEGKKAYDDPIVAFLNTHFATEKTGPNGDMSDIFKHYVDHDDTVKKNFWVAVQGSKIVGMVGAIPSTVDDPNDCLELVRMTVSSSVRRSGVGTGLVKQLEQYSRDNNFKYVNLTTLVRMKMALSFYESLGYELQYTKIEATINTPLFPQPVEVDVAFLKKAL
jgi:GNAT superfamily N-acetyltransferase